MFNFNYSLPQFFNNDLIYSYNYVNQINMINYIFNNEILKAQYLRQNCYNVIPDQQVNYNYFLQLKDISQTLILSIVMGIFMIPIFWDIYRVIVENFEMISELINGILRKSMKNPLKDASFFTVV